MKPIKYEIRDNRWSKLWQETIVQFYETPWAQMTDILWRPLGKRADIIFQATRGQLSEQIKLEMRKK